MKPKAKKDPFKIVESGYDRIAERYVAERERFQNWKELEAFCSLLPDYTKLLDVGCGTGIPVARHLIQQRYEVVGLDLSKEMISVARKNLPDATFFQKNMTELDFAPESFDGVISCYAIFHVPRNSHAAIFQSFHNILRPGGVMLVSVGSSEWEEVETYLGVEMFWSHYEPVKTEELIVGCGFDIEFGRTIHCGGESHRWVLARKV